MNAKMLVSAVFVALACAFVPQVALATDTKPAQAEDAAQADNAADPQEEGAAAQGEGATAQEKDPAPAQAESATQAKDPATDAPVLSLGAGSSAGTIYPTPLAAGDYVIARAGAGTQLLDVERGKTANGTNVQLYRANGTPAQSWRVSIDNQGLYTFTNIKSGKVLDVAWGKAKKGANVRLWKRNGTAAQKWIVVKTEGGYVLQSAIKRSLVLDCAWGGKRDGTNVQLWTRNGTQAQAFTFTSLHPVVESAGRVLDDGIYVIDTLVGKNKVLDVANGSSANGANVQVYSKNNSTAQRWAITLGSDGFYTIFSLVSGRVLEVAGGVMVPSANVQQYARNGTDAQKWAIQANDDGSYSLVNKRNGLRLAVSGGKSANGTNVTVARRSGATAQKFSFRRVSVLADGTYVFYAKAAQNSRVLDVKANSTAQGARLQAWEANGTTAQRFVVTGLGDDVYSIQAVASGKYLADSGGKVVQQAKARGGLKAAQTWKVSWRSGGLVLTNVATGKAITLPDAKAKSGTAATTAPYAGVQSRFRPVRYASLLSQGLYSFFSRASSSVLDVAGGSWASGANAQVYRPNGTNAQKFAVVPLGGNDYRIVMALSGTALDSSAKGKGQTGNVRLSKASGAASQVWHATLTDAGIVFTNKATGTVLGAASASAKSGTNVATQKETGAASQAWRLSQTRVNTSELGALVKAVRGAKSGAAPVVDTKGASYKMSSGAYRQLMNALARAWDRGRSVGFVMVDPATGYTMALNADTTIYGASTFKAAYVTYIFQDLVEKGRVRYEDVAGLMENTVVYSNNTTYETLRSRFGGAGFASWLDGIGLRYMAWEYYPYTTARKLELIWAKIYSYERSGGAYVKRWRSMFSHSYYSAIFEQLGGSATVYSKPGWYPIDGSHDALDDAGIVRHRDGSTYVFALLTGANCISERDITRGIVAAVDRVYLEMPH